MRINKVNLSAYKPNFKDNKFQSVPSEMKSERKDLVLLGLSALSVIGAAIVIGGISKKYNYHPLKAIKKTVHNFTNIIKNRSKIDIITRKLDGKRDMDAVNLYKGFKAEEKLKSLSEKLSNGDFSKKPPKVFEYLKANARVLQQQANYIY